MTDQFAKYNELSYPDEEVLVMGKVGVEVEPEPEPLMLGDGPDLVGIRKGETTGEVELEVLLLKALDPVLLL